MPKQLVLKSKESDDLITFYQNYVNLKTFATFKGMDVSVILSNTEMVDTLSDYVGYDFKIINERDLLHTKYLYNPAYSYKIIFDNIDSLDFENIVVSEVGEYKLDNQTEIAYYQMKNKIMREIMDSFHMHLLSEINTVLDIDNTKTIIGCHVTRETYTYVKDFITKTREDNVQFFVLTDISEYKEELKTMDNRIKALNENNNSIVLLKMLSFCEMIIGERSSLIDNALLTFGMMFVDGNNKNDDNKSDNTSLLKNVNILDVNCIFPNIKMLNKYM